MHRRIFLASAVLALCSGSSSRAQTSTMPSGIHSMAVRGWYDGDEMEPWDAEYSVADTSTARGKGVRMSYATRRDGSEWRYRFTAIWNDGPTPTVVSRWINGGRAPGTCDLTAERGQVHGRTSTSSELTPKSASDIAVPDFALGAYLASRPLANGDTIRLSVVRCLPTNGTNAIQVTPFEAVVRSAEVPRFGTTAVAAWVIEGDRSHPAAVTIAKSDRVVLRLRTPQGSVGHSEESYVGTRP